ncbi:asparagine synthase (glutamine-hydrolyzing) [Nocardia takedensis]|uniref:asparagine synthase (glutamine-hydrolyzing) n=1 Tax=Nocardia takedensis TaxID=259390 RepID=UPI003F7757FA
MNPVYSGCGIAGRLTYRHRTGAPVPGHHDVASMTAALAHRGPDGQGCWTGEGVVLGHRRLSIVGPGEAGAQPMTRAHLTITYNGELYNFRELRRELATEFQFTSDTDTEVLLRAWQRWGTAALPRLRGMFAFALWDHRTRELTLVRDRFGIKPLYFHHSLTRLAFASEAQALLQCVGVPRRPNIDALHHRLLCSSTLETDPRRTALDEVCSIPPATYLVVSAGGRLTYTRYWALPEPGDLHHHAGTGEPVELLADSVAAMLDADVPVATFLSGGLDSSAITALAHRQGPLTAVTTGHIDAAGSPDGHLGDDTRYSAALVEHLGADVVHRIHLRPNTITLDDIDAVCDLAAVCDDVRHVGIAANYQAVAGLGLRVVLNGQGADETMAGYVGRVNFVTDILDVTDPYPSINPRLPRTRQAPALSRDVLRHRHDADTAVEHVLYSMAGTPLERVHRLMVATQIPRIAQFEDFLAMRSGIEARFPFLDDRLVEWCFTGSFDRHLHPATRTGKIGLRAGTRDILPAAVRTRPKVGFPAPEAVAVHHSLAELVREHEPAIRRDPLVTALFDLPPPAHEQTRWPTQLLWLALTLWRWHHRLNSTANQRIWFDHDQRRIVPNLPITPAGVWFPR